MALNAHHHRLPRHALGKIMAERPYAESTFLTAQEVAAMMRVSKMTVYRLIHSGSLPAIQVGRSFRVPDTAVQEYLRRSTVREGRTG